MTGDRPTAADEAAFLTILGERRVTAVFQPLVDLGTGELVGFEALARGPEGTPFASPAHLFACADGLDRTVELDWACRAAAFEAYLEADVPPSMSLFVNVEIASLMEACPDDLRAVVGRAEASLRVFVEINDRALATDPAGLLATVERAREMGWGVSVDDVGTSLGCLSVLPVVGADVLKLDLRAVRPDADGAVSPLVATVLRHVEATGATLVVKGIESEADAHLAQALGARYGQGHHLGSPGPLTGSHRAPRAVVPLLEGREGAPPVADPFELAADLGTRRMTRAAMEQLAGVFATGALVAGSHPVVLIGFGDVHQDPATRAAGMRSLASMQHVVERSVLTAAFGVGAAAEPEPGVRGVDLPGGDVLADEPFLVILTEHLAVAMLGRPAPGAPGLVDVVATQEPQTVSEIAQHLIHRIPPPGASHRVLPPPLVDPDDGPVVEETDDGPGARPEPRARAGWFGRHRD